MAPERKGSLVYSRPEKGTNLNLPGSHTVPPGFVPMPELANGNYSGGRYRPGWQRSGFSELKAPRDGVQHFR